MQHKRAFSVRFPDQRSKIETETVTTTTTNGTKKFQTSEKQELMTLNELVETVNKKYSGQKDNSVIFYEKALK